MKFGKLNSDGGQNNLSSAETNVGAVFMTMAIENIYAEMGINLDDVNEVKISEADTYAGDYILLPICMHVTRAETCKKVFRMSPRIIPVFLALSMIDTQLSESEISYLQQYEPIGCRDEQTLKTMRKHHIQAYLLGCLVATFPKREMEPGKGKVFFVDVPRFVRDHIPDKIKGEIEFIRQERYLHELPEGVTPRDFALQIFLKYQNEARLIVSSRFHACVLAIALGIPYILINESYTYRFSWLKKLGNFYTRENCQDIDWEPKPLDFDSTKELMKEIAKRRIRETLDKYGSICTLSERMEDPFECEAGLIDYYDGAIEYIEANWDKSAHIQYAFWGVNTNTEAIYSYIRKNFVHAELVEVYDAYRTVTFHGITSISNECISADKNLFIFVTTFVAKNAAELLFMQRGIPEDRYYVCERVYVTDLKSL